MAGEAGDGYGDGYGYGSGDGYGYGDGDGYGDGSGDGYGYGSGYGYGYGYGDGYGDGSGDGYGDGYRDGYGSGYGDAIGRVGEWVAEAIVSPWGRWVRVGCQVLSLAEWRARWATLARDHRCDVSEQAAERLLAAAEAAPLGATWSGVRMVRGARREE